MPTAHEHLKPLPRTDEYSKPSVIGATIELRNVVEQVSGEPVSPTIAAQIYNLERGPNMGTEGAAEITADTCRTAIAFLDEIGRRAVGLPAPSSIAPSVTGEIGIYWKASIGRLHVKIGANSGRLIEYQHKGTDGRYTHGEGSLENILEKLAGIFRPG
jgi:hypothetical protein